MNNNITEDQRSEAINYLYPNQWCGPLGGSYNTDANWSGTIVVPELPGTQPVPVPQSPNGVDAVANFLDNLYADSTITLDSPATVGTINFKSVPRYTLAGPSSLTLQSSTTAQINVSLGNHTISAPLVIASNTIVAAGTNSLDLQGAQTWNDNTSLTVQSGTLNYAIPSGATSVGANVYAVHCAGRVGQRGRRRQSVQRRHAQGQHRERQRQRPERQRRQHRRRERERRRDNVGRGGRSIDGRFDHSECARYRRHVVQSGDRNDRCLGLARQSIERDRGVGW